MRERGRTNRRRRGLGPGRKPDERARPASGSAGSAAGATMRGGTVIVGGNAGARCGVAMKGGTLIVGGDVGYMTGFMMQKGRSDHRRRRRGSPGRLALRRQNLHSRQDRRPGQRRRPGRPDRRRHRPAGRRARRCRHGLAPADFKKIVSGKKLYNFDKNEKEIWKTAL